jgi:hypothetical protein
MVMQTIRVLEKTDKDGTLQLRVALGKPEAEYEIVLVVQPKATPSEELGWLREARTNQAALADTAQAVFAGLGIPHEPVEAEDVQRQMLAEGVRPEDDSFRRSIEEMREE